MDLYKIRRDELKFLTLKKSPWAGLSGGKILSEGDVIVCEVGSEDGEVFLNEISAGLDLGI